MNFNVTHLLRLHILILVYSLSTVFSKLAGEYEFLSLQFIIFFGLMFLCLGIYAIFWQKVLSRFKLSVAYANRAADLLWGIVFGAIFFSEPITVQKMVSVVIVFAGILLVIQSDV